MRLDNIQAFKEWARERKAIEVEPIATTTKTAANSTLNSKQRNSQRWFERNKLTSR